MLGNHEEINVLIEKMKKEIEEEGILYEEKVVFKEPSEIDAVSWGVDPHIHYFFPLTSHFKGISKVVIFFKRVIRKSLRFLLVPIIDEQSMFNQKMADEIDRLNQVIAYQENRITDLEKRLEKADF